MTMKKEIFKKWMKYRMKQDDFDKVRLENCLCLYRKESLKDYIDLKLLRPLNNDSTNIYCHYSTASSSVVFRKDIIDA